MKNKHFRQIVILTSFWVISFLSLNDAYLNISTKLSNICYIVIDHLLGSHWIAMGKCKIGIFVSHHFFLLTVRKCPKIEKWRHGVKWHHDVGTSKKNGNILSFAWELTYLKISKAILVIFLNIWQKQFLNDYFRNS